MKGMWIELLHEWMGFPPGVQKHVWEHVAKELIGRGVAKTINKASGEVQSAPVKEEVKREEVQEKAVEAPAQDKMIKSKTTTKKTFRRVM